MTDDTQAASDSAEKPSALQVLAGDAERIASVFVPDVHQLPAIVGVLAKQVEQLAGGKLTGLSDELLGIAPEQPEAPAAPAGGISVEDGEAMKRQLAEQAETIKALQAQREADRAAAAQIEGTDGGDKSASGGAAA